MGGRVVNKRHSVLFFFYYFDSSGSLASYSSTVRIRPSGLFPIRINLELWILETAGRSSWTGDRPCRKAATCTHRTTQAQKKRGQTCMPRVGFEHTILVFERAKSFHTLDHTANVIGSFHSEITNLVGSW
jgi:hypothetical protein